MMIPGLAFVGWVFCSSVSVALSGSQAEGCLVGCASGGQWLVGRIDEE